MIMQKGFCTLGLLALLTVGGVQAQSDRGIGHHAEKGYELFDAGRYAAAQQELEKARKELSRDKTGEAMRIDYLLAECAGKTGDPSAMEKFRAFLTKYPHSIYGNDVRFSMANRLSEEGKYAEAKREYLVVNPYGLSVSKQDEYNFKKGYAFFMNDEIDQAENCFRQVSSEGEYGPHATYYTAYIDYIGERYGVAKRGFQSLQNNDAYARVIPFYLLQIEMLEGNYNYVVREGDALLAAATGEREAEIARSMAEAWFHKGDYARTLSYMDHFRKAGGKMGREEYYLEGYADYMRNDIDPAIEALTQVCGPDDKLTQNAAYHLGGCYLRAGNKRQAMLSFSMAAGADYDDVIREDALFNYGKLQYELGGGVFNEAINLLSRYIREYPASPRLDEARQYLVAAYYNSKNYEAAYDAILQMPNPDNNLRAALQKIAYFRALEYYNAGNRDEAYRLLQQSLSNRFNAKYTALTQFWMGEILYEKGEYDKALPLYKEYISLSPESEKEHAMALYNVGYVYFDKQDWANARSWFTRFVNAYAAKDRYRADALNRLGDAEYAGREFWKAMENYNAAAKIGTPEKYYSQYQRAIALGLVNRRDTKIQALKDIVAVGQGEYVDDAMYELGRTYISMGRYADGASALKRFVDAYPSSPKYAAALADLGLASQNLGDNAAALRYYKQIVAQAPASSESKDALLAIKNIYVDMNDVDAYFSYAQKSGVETDLSVVARDSLAFVSAEKVYLSGATEKAADALDGYLERYPRGSYRPNALYYLADCELRAANKTAAIDALKELSELYYNDFTVRALENLSSLCYDEKRYGDAAEAYKKLAAVTVNPSKREEALGGYLKSVVAGGDQSEIAAAAEELLRMDGVSESVVRQARYQKACILDARGEKAEALALWKLLADEVQTPQGAEAAYRVIEADYAAGNAAGAEQAILAFAEKNSPQTYWLGKAFLILGDIYIDKGDSFQARATLQSIVDGYSPADDGIVAAAKERINRLK